MAADLPAWSGMEVNGDEPETQEQLTNSEEQSGPESKNIDQETKQVEIRPEDLTYSNVENVQGATATQQRPQVRERMESPVGNESVTKKSDDNESLIYETISSVAAGPSRIAPPTKPLPYLLSKKLKSTSGDGNDEKQAGKVKFPVHL